MPKYQATYTFPSLRLERRYDLVEVHRSRTYLFKAPNRAAALERAKDRMKSFVFTRLPDTRMPTLDELSVVRQPRDSKKV